VTLPIQVQEPWLALPRSRVRWGEGDLLLELRGAPHTV